MRRIIEYRLDDLFQTLYRAMLGAFPGKFRDEFSEEMAEVFGEQLAAAEEQGIWAVLVLGGKELSQTPVALLRLHLYFRGKKWEQIAQHFSQAPRPVVFGAPPADNDGRFSRLQLLFEITPFLLTAALILILTYQPPAWLPARWHDPLDVAPVWAGASLLGLLLGLARGMPRWAYPWAGLLAGYTLWVAAGQGLVWLWGVLLVMSFFLAIMAVIVHRGERPLPPIFRRLGASVALDWTRLSFGVFGAAPLLVLASFDNAYLNWRTGYLALALALMVMTAVGYCLCRRQNSQLATLLGGTTLLLVPALMESITWQGSWGDAAWLVGLWAWMVALLFLPLFAVLVQWMLVSMPAGRDGGSERP